ncbi:helix-turn-helix domain-containing protein [Streptomyces qinglanensis]|uniref:helix-turn-helix domain-containing protein n=1 Tax=Streptomyces qinglanensis TaxID=943816 RepID=UPI0009437E5E
MQARGYRIRRQREESGYGLTAFANRIGVSPSWLSRIERDQANPSPDLLRRIALTLRSERAARAAISEIALTQERRDEDTPAD